MVHAQNIALLIALLSAIVPGASIAQANPQTKAVPGARAAAPAKPATSADAAMLLNIAARQQMLAERMTRTYAMIGQKVLVDRARRQLDVDVKNFEKQLKTLLQAPLSAETRENYELLEQLWGDFRAITGKPPSLELARQLAEQNEELAWIAEKGAGLIQNQTRLARSEAILLAARASTLSQRMAKLYFFRSWGLRAEVIAKDLKAAEAEYLAAMRRLTILPENSAATRQELVLADHQWLFFSGALAKVASGEDRMVQMDNVAKSSDNLLQALEQLGVLYEAAAR